MEGAASLLRCYRVVVGPFFRRTVVIRPQKVYGLEYRSFCYDVSYLLLSDILELGCFEWVFLEFVHDRRLI